MAKAPDKLASVLHEILRSLSEPLPYSEPHQRVLREAMRLMSRRGYAGASLRTLAQRLRMSQPSLYHYFSSKHELVEQIIRMYAARAMRLNDNSWPQIAGQGATAAKSGIAPAAGSHDAGMPLPDVESLTLEQALRLSLQRMAENYADPEQIDFRRFMLVLGLERPELRALGRRLLMERAAAYVQRLVDVYVEAGELLAEDAPRLVELLLNAHGMYFMRRQILFGEPSEPGDDAVFADFLVDTAVRGVKSRARSKRATGARNAARSR